MGLRTMMAVTISRLLMSYDHGTDESLVDSDMIHSPVQFTKLDRWLNIAAIVFNTGFALLAIVTVAGIVFITKPKQVMHDISPRTWPLLLALMTPAQLYAAFLGWRTILSGQNPTAPAVAIRQIPILWWLKPAVAVFWIANFVIEFGIVVSLSKPHPGRDGGLAGAILLLVLSLWFAFVVNVFLMLAIRALTDDTRWLERLWRRRVWLDALMAIFGFIYYRI